jgi:hypothetical protein
MQSATTLYESLALGRPLSAKENNMKRATTKKRKTDELRGEYDLSEMKGRVRGKYLQRYRSGTNLVLLSPDVAEHFPNSQAVNSALRTLIRRSKNI